MEVWGKGTVVMEQTQKGLPVHILGLKRENVNVRTMLPSYLLDVLDQVP